MGTGTSADSTRWGQELLNVGPCLKVHEKRIRKHPDDHPVGLNLERIHHLGMNRDSLQHVTGSYKRNMSRRVLAPSSRLLLQDLHETSKKSILSMPSALFKTRGLNKSWTCLAAQTHASSGEGVNVFVSQEWWPSWAPLALARPPL